MAKFKVDDILIAKDYNKIDVNDLLFIFTIEEIHSSIGGIELKVYVVRLVNGRTSYKSTTWVDERYRKLTKAERLLYGR